MRIVKKDSNIILESVIDFNIEQTLECGQCFHFEKIDELEYVVIALDKLLHIKQEDDKLIFFDKDEDEVINIWIKYFDLERDYAEIKSSLLAKDKKLFEAITKMYGVRILNQEFYEMVISFIISQNKQIPHIKKIVFDLSNRYGNVLGQVNGKEYYSFPELETFAKITEESFRELKTGFRAPYLVDASLRITSDFSRESFEGLSYQNAKERLMQIKGIGEKVANCVLLFGLSYRNAFPVDVWIKRIMQELYFEGKDTPKNEIEQFANKQFGDYGGYAQQYLFYFARKKD